MGWRIWSPETAYGTITLHCPSPTSRVQIDPVVRTLGPSRDRHWRRGGVEGKIFYSAQRSFTGGQNPNRQSHKPWKLTRDNTAENARE